MNLTLIWVELQVLHGKEDLADWSIPPMKDARSVCLPSCRGKVVAIQMLGQHILDLGHLDQGEVTQWLRNLASPLPGDLTTLSSRQKVGIFLEQDQNG